MEAGGANPRFFFVFFLKGTVQLCFTGSHISSSVELDAPLWQSPGGHRDYKAAAKNMLALEKR